MKYQCFFEYENIFLTIREENECIIEIEFNQTKKDDFIEKETPLLAKVKLELTEYFNKKRKSFSVPINPKGTPFQKTVWKQLTLIPYGQTRSYQEIARDINNVKAVRAVGGANNKNPIPILIPCHRVIGKNNKLVGYAGGLDLKEKLLCLEESYYGINNNN